MSLAALFSVAALLLYVLADDGPPVQRLSVATAYVGLVFLAATLVVGPLNVRTGRANPVSATLRRDLGIWAAIGGILHTVIGFQVHMRGDIVQYFVPATGARSMSKSTFAFLSANYTGLGATLLFALLLVISNDIALRGLGTTRWKRIQRYNYLLFALVVAHGALYLVVDRASWVRIVPFVVVVAFVVHLQIQGRLLRVRRVRRGDGE